MSGTLHVVATPIGNLEDITLRAIRVLKEAGLIAAEDTRHTARLLQRYEIRTPMTSFHEHNEREKLPSLIGRLKSGQSLAIVSDAGTPGVCDPGYRLVRAAIDEGISVEVVPGPSALLTALLASGLPSDSFTFLGFPPAKGRAREAWIAETAAQPRTVVFFEAPHRIRQTLEDLGRMAGTRAVAVARELTKFHEQVARGTLSDIIGQLPEPRGEFTVVLGPSTGLPSRVAPSDETIWSDFQRLVTESRTSRRAAISALVRRHGLSSKAIYDAIERQKARQAQQ